MLVLSRKQGEAILIGDVRVSVVKAGGKVIRIGIEAPRGVKVLREELLGEKQDGSTR